MKQVKLSEAISLAAKKHLGQYRWDGTPYILHPLRILGSLTEKYGYEDEELLICAVLHDIIEDTSTSIEEIEGSFGKSVARTLVLLTHNEDESYEEYIATLLKDRRACLIKLADIEDNSFIGGQTGTNVSEEKQAERYMKYLKAYNLIKESLGK